MAEKRITNETETDYRLVGVGTSLKEYRLCFYLNQILGCDFRKLESLVFQPKDRTRKIEFSVFKAEDALKNIFMVFTNKNLGEYLLPEISNFDYLVQIKGKYNDNDTNAFLESLRAVPEVVLCLEVPLKKIKSKERLTYEEEKEVQRLISPKRFKK